MTSELDREDRLRRLSTAVRIVGIALMALGLACFPVGLGVSPKRDLNFFNNLADLGMFWKAGLALLGVGFLVVIVSVLISGGDDEQ